MAEGCSSVNLFRNHREVEFLVTKSYFFFYFKVIVLIVATAMQTGATGVQSSMASRDVMSHLCVINADQLKTLFHIVTHSTPCCRYSSG